MYLLLLVHKSLSTCVYLEIVFRLQMTECTGVITTHVINAPLHTLLEGSEPI